MTVVIFNGPPGSGKDTLADYFESKYNFQHLRFKDGLIPLVLKAYKVDREWWDAHYVRDLKNTPFDELCGMSPREALINMSENIIKPAFGEAAFGIIASRKIITERHSVFSDGGFIDELRPVVEKVGADKVLIFQLSRPGCDFSIDSRSYYPDSIFGCQTIKIENTGTVEELCLKVEALLIQ